ncbi:hypothetical protein F8M41_001274 [Gigaspora margarita]|uniref:Uncharacterized protein n=1 Tax=Gigaspora margarita TaxID=4874 RepID=A0A8H4B560_GIGMA|nr:hypothetical protein F8M41_001274 [Gigaspora margarita]
MWYHENTYTMKQAITEAFKETNEGKKISEQEREEEGRKYIEWLRRTEVPPCIVPKKDIVPGSKNGKSKHKKEFTNILMIKIYEKIWKPSRETISNILEEKERNIIKDNIPIEPIHGKEIIRNAAKKYSNWKKSFIEHNEKVDTIEDYD